MSEEVKGYKPPVTETSLASQRSVGVLREVTNADPVTNETLKALRDARAEWQQDGKGLRGSATNPTHNFHKAPVLLPRPLIVRNPVQPPFPQRVVEETTNLGGGQGFLFPFQLVDTTNDDGLRVRVVNGKVNDVLPDGMVAGIDYNLWLVEESYQAVYLIYTFDPESLEQTSLTIGISDDPPSSSWVGDGDVETPIPVLVIQLGFITITYGDDATPIVDITQSHVGDVRFELIYGSLNGYPALLPVAVYGAGWIQVPQLDDDGEDA